MLEKFKLFFNSTVGVDDEVKSFLFTTDGTALTQSGGALDVNIASSDISLSAADSVVIDSLSAPTVTTSEVTVTAVSGQKKVTIQNLSNSVDIYYGPTGVTTATGLIIPKQSSQEIDLAGNLFLIAGSAVGAGNVRVAHWTAT